MKISAVIFYNAFAMVLQRFSKPATPLSPGETMDTVELILITVAVLAAWFFVQWILSALLIRKATAFCPQCFGDRIRQSSQKKWELLTPFVRAYYCLDCGQRFFRGRKSPFARCPGCRSAKLQTLLSPQAPKGLGNVLRRVFGGHSYRCNRCQFDFVDFRPLHAATQTRDEKSGTAVGEPAKTLKTPAGPSFPGKI